MTGERRGKDKEKLAIDPDIVRELARLLDETGLNEIEVERDGQRVRVARPGAVRLAAAAPLVVGEPARLDPAKHPGVVSSPMVGTAYVGPEPGARPFVEVGSQVKIGDPLLIVEAMKTMNQIPSPRAGTV